MDLLDFVKHQYKNYKVINNYAKQNSQNFASLDISERNKGEILVNYFKQDDLPGQKFPQIKKIYEELQESLKTHFEDLQKKTRKVYQSIFNELEQKSKELVISDEKLFFDTAEKLREIEKENNITTLQLLHANVHTYKADVLENMVIATTVGEESGAESDKKTERFKIKITEIRDEGQLNIYLDWLRNEILKRLNDEKIIIIE